MNTTASVFDNTTEKEMLINKIEKERLINQIKAMTEEEQKTVVKELSTSLLYEELGSRLAENAKFVEKITAVIQETLDLEVKK